MDLSLVIPTYNEKENVSSLIHDLEKEFKEHSIKGEIIFVDDNSPDGTGEILNKEAKKNKNIKVIHRKGKEGLSSAVIEGWKNGNGEVLGVMDSDLSHPTTKIHEMLETIKKGRAEIVIGSRYIKGGKIIGWGIYRKMLSKGATFLARTFTKVNDPMSGFFMIQKKCLKDADINPRGFKILLEVLIKANYKSVKEMPITFTDRTKGKSKAGTKEILYYIRNLTSYLPYKKHVFKEFVSFAFVGFIGTIVNLFVLFLLTEFLGLYYLLSAIISFLVAMTNNFILNKKFTFKEKLNHEFTKKYGKFFLVSMVALGVNLLFLYIFTELIGIYYLVSQIFAIGIALIINFIGNKIWTF